MTDMLMQSVAAAPSVPTAPATNRAPEAGEKLVIFGQRITLAHKERLSRHAFWRRRNERRLLDRALSEFFARQDPELLRPIPEE